MQLQKDFCSERRNPWRNLNDEDDDDDNIDICQNLRQNSSILTLTCEEDGLIKIIDSVQCKFDSIQYEH